MARNGSGSYSLPVGNPVVLGTTISSTWANATLADLAAEMTDSLSRSGKGAMSAPLALADGTVTLPGLAFSSDPDSGLYRIGANNLGVAVNGTKILDIGAAASSGVGAWTFTGTLDVTGVATLSSTVHIVGAITADSTISSKKLTATGGAGVEGAALANGTAATGATPQNALVLTNGHMSMAGVVDPNSTIALSKVLVPGLIPRAWALVNIDAAGAITIVDGFNVASVAVVGGGGTCQVTLAQPMASANYAPMVTALGVGTWFPVALNTSDTLVGVHAYDAAGAGAAIVWTDGTARQFAIALFGRQ